MVTFTGGFRNNIRTDRSSGNYQNPSRTNSRSAAYNGPAIKTGAKAVYASMQDYKERGINRVLKFPKEETKYFTLLEFAKYNRIFGTNNVGGTLAPAFNVIFEREGAIALPLPHSGMVDKNSIRYDQFDLGLLGAAAGTAMNKILSSGALASAGQTIQQGFNSGDPTKAAAAVGEAGLGLGSEVLGFVGEQGYKAIGSAFTDPTGAFKKVATLGAEAAGLGAVTAGGNLAAAMTGYIPNNFLTILFKSPVYKTHAMSFKLMPSNLEESLAIRDIIIKLNNIAAPGLGAGGALFNFPYVVYPSYRPNADFLYKFKPCVITGISSDYNPGRSPAFYTARRGDQKEVNAPEAVTLTLELMEIEFWLRNQFDDRKGYDAIDTVAGTHRDISRAATIHVAKTATEGKDDGYRIPGVDF